MRDIVNQPCNHVRSESRADNGILAERQAAGTGRSCRLRNLPQVRALGVHISKEIEMRLIGGLLLVVLLILAGGIATGFIELQKTQEGSLPKIAVEGGQLPKFNADVAKVEVGTRNETVEVPTVDVKKP
jgi:hypothetical protein